MKKKPLLPENPEQSPGSFPSWLHQSLPSGKDLFATTQILKEKRIHTVCESAKCPNRRECYSKKTATFLALGNACTRNCSFCDIDFSKTPKEPEKDEPQRIALTSKELGLKHIVITMVARDDLPDEGSSHISAIIQEVRKENSACTIEVLTSDFSGRHECLDIVLKERPEIFNHNIETVRTLTSRVRHKATYERTLRVLSYAKNSGKTPFVKSGLMVGLGETEEEVKQTIKDLFQHGCDIITIGQYLQPSRHKTRVKAFIHPDLFRTYKEYGYELGVKHIHAGPFVRSSYNAQAVKNLVFTHS